MNLAKISKNGQITVPNLVKVTEENALNMLEQLGLKGNKTGEIQSFLFEQKN